MTIIRRLALCGLIAAAFALPALTPTPAKAWWAPGPRWGWHGGVVVAPPVFVPPRVVVAAPVYAPAYPYPAPYHWVRAHYTPYGAFVPGHWGY